MIFSELNNFAVIKIKTPERTIFITAVIEIYGNNKSRFVSLIKRFIYETILSKGIKA